MDRNYRSLTSSGKLWITVNMIMVGAVFWVIALYLNYLGDRSSTADQSNLEWYAIAFLFIGTLILGTGAFLVMRIFRLRSGR